MLGREAVISSELYGPARADNLMLECSRAANSRPSLWIARLLETEARLLETEIPSIKNQNPSIKNRLRSELIVFDWKFSFFRAKTLKLKFKTLKQLSWE